MVKRSAPYRLTEPTGHVLKVPVSVTRFDCRLADGRGQRDWLIGETGAAPATEPTGRRWPLATGTSALPPKDSSAGFARPFGVARGVALAPESRSVALAEAAEVERGLPTCATQRALLGSALCRDSLRRH